MSRIPVWIDTDTGVDDAFALMTAFSLQDMEVKGISAVAGNVPLSHTFINARNVVSLCGREDVPVYPGADKPLMIPLQTAEYVHGVNGLGEAVIPDSKAEFETEKAWDALYRCAKQCQGTLELILLGPETNAAIALNEHPDLVQYLKRILIMGGAAVGGNSTPAAEFNIFVDPQAAQIVFKSGIPIIMCGLDVTMKAGLNTEEMAELDAGTAPGCKLFRDSTQAARNLYSERVGDVYIVHDACPVIYAVKPELFKGETAGVYVETRGRLTFGQTVTDLYTDVPFKKRNAAVITDVDRSPFAKILMEAIQKAGQR